MKLDRYTYCARLLPALIVLLPFLILLFIASPIFGAITGLFSAIGLSVALIFLVAQCGRDAGKRKEPKLFDTIGGKPSTRLLRHRDATLPPATKTRYHSFLKANVPGFALPTLKQETDKPDAADKMYASAVDWLLAKTRDTKLHELLFAENISYGFRRNLWGMKPVGILACLLSISVITAILSGIIPFILDTSIALATIMAMTVLLSFWLFTVRVRWVAVPAEAYAKSLLEFCDK